MYLLEFVSIDAYPEPRERGVIYRTATYVCSSRKKAFRIQYRQLKWYLAEVLAYIYNDDSEKEYVKKYDILSETETWKDAYNILVEKSRQQERQINKNGYLEEWIDTLTRYTLPGEKKLIRHVWVRMRDDNTISECDDDFILKGEFNDDVDWEVRSFMEDG